MKTLNIPNTRRHQKFINEIIQAVKENTLDLIEGVQKENYEEQFSYIEFSSSCEEQMEKFIQLVSKLA